MTLAWLKTISCKISRKRQNEVNENKLLLDEVEKNSIKTLTYKSKNLQSLSKKLDRAWTMIGLGANHRKNPMKTKNCKHKPTNVGRMSARQFNSGNVAWIDFSLWVQEQ